MPKKFRFLSPPDLFNKEISKPNGDLSNLVYSSHIDNHEHNSDKNHARTKEQRLSDAVTKHQDALISHWHRTVKTDEYGQTCHKKWIVEVERFLKKVNYGRLKYERVTNPHHVTELVQAIIKKRELGEGNISSDESVFKHRKIADAWDFEKLCAEELTRIGWNAIATNGGADQGIDVIATRKEKKLILQCKLYGSAVGNKAVQEAISGKAFESADYAAVVAPNGFTKSAYELALKAGVLLLHPSELGKIDNMLMRT